MEVNLIAKDEDVPENLVTFKYVIEKGDFFGESIPVSALVEEIGADWKIIEGYLSKGTISFDGQKHELKSCYTTRTDKDMGLMIDFEEPHSSDD